MRYYTRTGDAGETSLYTGERVPKESLRVEAYGAVDELQASMGLARSTTQDAELDADVEQVERKLVDLMAQLASTDGVERISADDVAGIEWACDKYTDRIDAKGFKFEVPGTSQASSALHVARTVARRAERRILAFAREEDVAPELLKYVNRISDLLFAMAVYVDLER